MTDQYQDLIHLSRYARWLDDVQRRETWQETVGRYFDYMGHRVPTHLDDLWNNARAHVMDREVMPSMRAMWTAGPALERCNVAGYNCAYLAINSGRKFSELLYILLCGTGCGFSVEMPYVSQLPTVPSILTSVSTVLRVADSKRGWASAYNALLGHLYNGGIPVMDTTNVRPAGSRLKTFGGRASGPEPLEELFEYTIHMFLQARGRKLRPIECHDLCCKIASIVVVGGVRRSACISLSDLNDQEMAEAKFGEFWNDPTTSHRTLANNSAVYMAEPTNIKLMAEWSNLIRSRSGERGIFNRIAAEAKVDANERRQTGHAWGINPCGEIILRPDQFCNLSEVVVRPDDGLPRLREKVIYATLIGCVQSTLTNFKYISKSFKRNCEEERLLGVSLTGVMDHPVLQEVGSHTASWLADLRETAIDAADRVSVAMGIPMPAAVTTVKPSGTVSQLVGTSSGLHPAYAPQYIRRMRMAATDPLCKLMRDQGIPHQPENGDNPNDPKTWVFEFPQAAPEGAVTRDQLYAIKQLDHWLMMKRHWAEHNPSITVYIKEHEWLDVLAWVKRHWNETTGIAFLPFDGGSYPLAPYEEITPGHYNHLVKDMPRLDLTKLKDYENNDQTTGSQELACVGGACEL